jgi:hypothetical protein
MIKRCRAGQVSRNGGVTVMLRTGSPGHERPREYYVTPAKSEKYSPPTAQTVFRKWVVATEYFFTPRREVKKHSGVMAGASCRPLAGAGVLQ